MAKLTITVNNNGIPNPVNGTVHTNSANGDTQVQWQSGAGAGTHTIDGLPTGIFTVDPPSSITISPANPSDTYTVKSDAATGDYTYTVGTGTVPNGQPKIIVSP
jgi:hypothetical protein